MCINTTEAKESALKGLHQFVLTNPELNTYIEMGVFDSPLLVERQDKKDPAYYLVPWGIKNGVLAIFKIDALNGDSLGFVSYPLPIKNPIISQSYAVEQIKKKYPDCQPVFQNVIWEPCRQSYTPYQPFYFFLAENLKLFVTMDGKVFNQMIPLGRGG